jgi:hypothetical protein
MQGEDRSSYSPNWSDTNTTNTSLLNVLQSSFLYQSASDLSGSPYWGRRRQYSGGGYVANLGNTKQEARDVITDLKQNSWLDGHTTAVFLEFNVYSANNGLFNLVTLVVEFLPEGGTTNHHTIQSVQLYRYNAAQGVFALLTEIACLIFIVFIVIMEIREVVKQRKKYFSVASNWLQLSAVVCFLVAMVMYAMRSVWTQRLVTVMMNNRGK